MCRNKEVGFKLFSRKEPRRLVMQAAGFLLKQLGVGK